MSKLNADILIVGGGIIGLTIARELVQQGHQDIIIIDKEKDLAKHASGRNSGVLHAGIYYTPDSLKARSCLSGNFLMRDYCKEKELPLLETGKVIVTRDEKEIPALKELYQRAVANGARVDIIDQHQLGEIEPNARTVENAIYSHDTAVVDPKKVMASLQADLVSTGKVQFFFDCAFVGTRGRNTALTSHGDIGFHYFINAAGAHCDRVARSFNLGLNLRMIPFKGIYKKLRKHKVNLVRGNIYPVPDIRNPFLGIHFTRSAHGEVYLGPTAIPALGRENYGLIEGIDAEGLAILYRDAVLFFANPKFRDVALKEPKKYLTPFFFNSASKLVKELHPSDIEPADKVGIRAQLVDWDKKELVLDFLVEKEENSIHILNPVSPAFTSSMDLAQKIVKEISEQ
ncbi:MAG: L-2-hydroxyglutarate oxidase [Syntrophobacterales bacterium]|jgi:L-2-hydroxyglutarate oxidase LhgO